ncbi:AcrR family transcriptional regulator [Nocardioides zeae]|uniref:AcrR family transcriptional regulator n=1 Tax=Nocardioides zeae TaxID=1457234 RepID=A0ACC6IHU7_9ACTN|nr:helix-turn-helix domain-containing protein [Nocardioides zeae]MDR6176120.1 AcrR family transcriptional regulator [Nocardioides zeae]MDR6210266.1 AcrR family transcriptional regulator [Nocardioides zeae]
MPKDPDRPRRRYVSPVREAALAATHGRIVDAAAELFSSEGYRSTTLAAIAARAGVSVPRVNLSGSKPALLVEAYQRRAGTTPEQPISESPELQELMKLPADEALPAYAAWLSQVHAQSVGLWFALREAAATDPEAATAFEAVERSNDEACLAAVAWADGLGLLTGDVPTEERAATWAQVAGAEPFRHFVVKRGWSAERYQQWVRRAIERLVLDPA